MLIRFKISNFLSFDEVQTLSMISGKTESHSAHVMSFDNIGVLRTSALYGANASGKTNIIKAMVAMKNLVVFNEPMLKDRYHRPTEDNRKKPSLFEVEIECGGRLFSYGFEIIISEGRIVDEWLHELFIDRDSAIIFERTGSKIIHYFEGEDRNRIEIYAEDTVDKNGLLFLTAMKAHIRPNDEGLRTFADIYDWFAKKLLILDSNVPFIPTRSLSEEYFDRLNRFMASFGTGINEIGYETKAGMENILPKEITEDMKKQLMSGKDPSVGMRSTTFSSSVDYRVSLSENSSLVFDEIVYRHKGGATFHSHEESDGTKKLYSLLANIFSDDAGVTLLMDELDSRLHPQLTYHLVKLFLENRESEDKQLIFTTHESCLMDFELLRRDEIWFIEKSNQGSSRLYSLEDFNERMDRRIEKAYREGRYGGVPIFSTVFPLGERR